MRKVAPFLLLLSLVACGGSDGPEIWIYTSIYPQVIEQIEPVLAERFSGVTFRWYQKGSEQIAARLNTEFAAGGTECDLLLTSDPFYYAQLKASGRLLAYETDATKDVPAELKDPDHFFAAVRIPLMVLAVHEGLDAAHRPLAFGDLLDPALRGQVTMGDPLKSGTNFTAVAALSTKYGWPFYETLRQHDVMAAGGNSAVLRRLESGERRVGIILLENLLPRILEASDESYPVDVVYPEDGAIPIPSPAAILRATDEPELAKQVFDALFGPEIQAAIVAGYMYSPLPDVPPPRGAPALPELTVFPWTNAFLEAVRAQRDDIKQRWREVMR